MATSQPLNDANIEHQIALIRYSQGRANTLLPFLREIVDYIEVRLSKEGDSIATKKRLNALLSDVNKKLDSIYTKWDEKEFQPTLPAVSENELEFQSSSTEAVTDGFESTIPANAQVMSAAFNNPVLIGAKGGAVDFGKYTKNWKPQEIQRVANRISTGFYTGETTSEIARAINGLKSQKYADGILNMSRANIQGMVKSSITHMSSTAKAEFANENKDLIIGERWVSTLDSKTSDICRFRDGEVYLFSEYGNNYPRPPAHINCRSTMAPELSDEYSFLKESRTRPAVSDGKAEQVPGTQTYYTWLKNQPAPVQNEALGVEQAKVFRNAGLSPEEFRKATVNRLGQPISLEQMSKNNKQIASYLQKQG